MPIGLRHGWGIAGLNAVQALSRIVPLEILSREYHQIMRDPGITAASNGLIGRLLNGPASMDLLAGIPQHGTAVPMVSAIQGANLRPLDEDVSGPENVGYTFFEDDLVAHKAAKAAHRWWDKIVCGSSWCADVLTAAGCQAELEVGVQGVDCEVFRPIEPAQNNLLRTLMGKWGQQDRFIVFSGGKFELRKGQDAVIKAMKVIMERHSDVMLVGAWANMWPDSLKTMAHSPCIRFNFDEAADARTNIIRTAIENGIPHDRFQYVGSVLHPAMAEIYNACDLGVFPNRCEGGTNLALMEFMACQKPVIATPWTGHRDIVNIKNSYDLLSQKKGMIEFKVNNVLRAEWRDVDIDELIEQIEKAYQDRKGTSMEDIALAARTSMYQHTWDRLAQVLLPNSLWDCLPAPVIIDHPVAVLETKDEPFF